MRESKIIAAWMLMAAFCASISAQVQPAPVKTPEEPGTGTISGRVVNELGQPLAGAYLVLRATGALTSMRSTTSDAEGNFRVNGLDSALYSIVATAPSYVTETTPSSVHYRIGDTVRLQLVPGGVITGTVTNGAGEPVIGVRVRATKIRDAAGAPLKQAGFGFIDKPTDDRGVYRIYGVAPGTYLVSAGGGGGFSSFNPYDSDVPSYSPSSSRDTAAEIVVEAGEESSADIRYRGEPGYSISGSVRVASANGATITLMSAKNSTTLANTFQPAGARGFSFNGLEDGEYKLTAQEFGGTPSATLPVFWMSDVMRVTIKGASVSGVELLTKPLASISGRVSIEPSNVSECEGKRPPQLVETMISLQRHEKDLEDDDPIYVLMNANSAAPDASGAFMLRNLRPGRYQLDPRFFARYWYLQSMTANAGGAKAQKIDVAGNWTVVKSGEQVNNVIVTLAGGAASIRGRLALAEGSTVPTTTLVYLVPFESSKADDVLRYFVAPLAPDGAFAFNSLPPGKYRIVTLLSARSEIATMAKLRQPEAAASRANIRRLAEMGKSELELKPCQNLTDYQLKH